MSNKTHSCSVQYTKEFCYYSLTLDKKMMRVLLHYNNITESIPSKSYIVSLNCTNINLVTSIDHRGTQYVGCWQTSFIQIKASFIHKYKIRYSFDLGVKNVSFCISTTSINYYVNFLQSCTRQCFYGSNVCERCHLSRTYREVSPCSSVQLYDGFSVF